MSRTFYCPIENWDCEYCDPETNECFIGDPRTMCNFYIDAELEKKGIYESKGKKKRFHEDVEDFNYDLLYSFIYNRLSDALDNIAIVAASEVPGYDADWCEDTGDYSRLRSNLFNALTKLTNAVVELLIVNR